MSGLPLWDIFFQTVEGRPGAVSAVMSGGNLAMSPEPIAKGAKPDPALLVELLRSEKQIPTEVRAWMADLLDQDGRTALRLTFRRRARGAPAARTAENWPVADYFAELLDAGHPRKRALGLAADKFGVSRSTAEAAIASLRAATHEAAAAKEHDAPHQGGFTPDEGDRS